MARMKFLCDADRCIDCNACVTACKNENEVPWGINRRRVVTINDGKPGERSVSMACMHCTDAPCAAVCPVTCIYPFSDLDQAIAQANSLPFAFQASVFAGDIDVALRSARSLDASTILINDHTAFRVDWMPFAGRRQSGYGVGGIPYTMHDMTQEKMIVLRLK